MVEICEKENAIMVQIGNVEFIKNTTIVKIKYICQFCNSKRDIFINYATKFKTVYNS